MLRRALDAARVGRAEKLQGFSRLDAFTRAIERQRDPAADVEAAIEHERAISRSIGGRTVFDDARAARTRPRKGQLGLF